MSRIVIASFAAGLLAAALPAQAAETNVNASRSDESAQEQPQAGGAPSERRICVREALSDSRMRRPICHTVREWRDIQGDVPGNR